MKTDFNPLHNMLKRLRAALIVLCTALGTWGVAFAAASGPAQSPMMSVATGAAPDVILSIDNSGSMSWSTLDNYQFRNTSSNITRSNAAYTEYYNWKCKSSTSTGPFKDDDGYYYCVSSTSTPACPNGFNGPSGTAPNQYCTQTQSVYSCPSGYAGPTKSGSNQVCTATLYSYSCSDSSYSIAGTGSARTCTKNWTEYTCPSGYDGPITSGGGQKCRKNYSCPTWKAALGSGSNSNQCYNYQCSNGYTVAANPSNVANCQKNSSPNKNSWDSSKLSLSGTKSTTNYTEINATGTAKTDSNASLVVATPYTDTKIATATPVVYQYDNVQDKVKNVRQYQNKTTPTDSTAGAYAQNSRTTTNISGVTTTIVGGDWYAIRSGQVNPMYYDSTTTYLPRISSTGLSNDSDVSATDFIYNDDSTVDDSGQGYAIPSVRKTTLTNAQNKGYTFTYVVCSTYNDKTCTVQNPAKQVVKVSYGTVNIDLPLGHQRTDCGGTLASPATQCTGAAERLNILRWYTYYRTRSDAMATSLGLALANPNYSGKMRVGFFNINNGNGDANPVTSWSTANNYSRPVRPFVLGSNTDNTTYVQPIFTWLYSQSPNGSTPLHNSLNKVADYFNTDQPWYNDTINSASGRLNCRRSYNILFSDGAWNQSATATNNDYNFDGVPPVNYGTSTNATLDTPFAYSYKGDPTNPASYIAYPSFTNNSSNSLASLAARYNWQRDLVPNLQNKITTRTGEPVSWQSMKTYTIGYGIQPTGFTFDDVRDWQASFVKLGYQADMVPNWHSSSSWGDPEKVNDFIHAGFAGGGKSFSVYSPDQIRRAFDLALSDVVSAAGNDAGVAVSGASSSVSTIEGSLKYTVDYKTLDNSGDVKAWKLDANGSNATVNALWSAKDNMPRPINRKMSTWSSVSGATPLTHATILSLLPTDVKNALNNGNANLATDASFIQYLRGEDGISNPTGDLYRRRTSLIASSVNSPPVYLGGRLNMGYDRSASNVGGKSAYAGYITDKGNIPGVIYAPTNDGQVHVFNAADDTATPSQKIKNLSGQVIKPGAELWSYVMLGSLNKMQDFANAAYNFNYVLDGPISEHDIYNSSTNTWAQMAYGSQGRAAKGGIYALQANLDKSDSTNLNRIPTAAGYKWEASPADMGYVTNPSTAGQTVSGDWVLLASSGLYAGTGKAGLYVLNANTGAMVKFIELPAGYNFKRGLGGVTAIRNAERKIVGAYAGDDGGNLWRFDLSDASSGNWGVSYGKPLFTTPGTQPIYVAPAWTPHPGDGQPYVAGTSNGCIDGRTVTNAGGITYAQQCGAMVMFGTGMMMDADDKLNNTAQTIYGIWDRTPIGLPNDNTYKVISKSTDLLQQTITVAGTQGAGLNAANTYYKVSNNVPNWASHRGWYLDVGVLGKVGSTNTGERFIGDVFNLGSNVFISSVVPDTSVSTADTCTVKASPPNYLYGLDALSGGLKRAFDQNGDGRADQFAIAYIPGGGFTRGSVITQTSKDSSSTAGLGLPTEGNPDLQIKNKCSGEQGYDTGINGSVQVFDSCAAGWKRSWRQILTPPTF